MKKILSVLLVAISISAVSQVRIIEPKIIHHSKIHFAYDFKRCTISRYYAQLNTESPYYNNADYSDGFAFFSPLTIIRIARFCECPYSPAIEFTNEKGLARCKTI